MEQVSRHFRRSFHDASVSYSSLAHATLRATAPFSAEYPPLISVAYTWIHDNRESHQLATDIKRRNDGSRQTPKAEEFASARRAGTDSCVAAMVPTRAWSSWLACSPVVPRERFSRSRRRDAARRAPDVSGECVVKVAIYARYSSDNQRDASIADQLRICRLHAEKQGWQVVEEYTDHAISGASLLRPGIQALISDATRGRFRYVLAEAMDRLSRDQEDIAGLYKRMAYSDVNSSRSPRARSRICMSASRAR
jgi:hypothetical protein